MSTMMPSSTSARVLPSGHEAHLAHGDHELGDEGVVQLDDAGCRRA